MKSLLAAASNASHGGGGIFVLVFLLIALGICVTIFIAYWKMFEKAGKPGWAIFVPFYNTVVRLEMVNLPLWWILFMFVPIVNLVVYYKLCRRIATVFGKQGVGFTLGLFFLPFIFVPILGFGTSMYNNTFPPSAPMGAATRWTFIAIAGFLLVEGFFIMVSNSSDRHHEPLKTIGDSTGYATDGTYVYLSDESIPGADPETFKLLGTYSTYAVDDHAAYYDGIEIQGADPKTFSWVGDDYAKDAEHVYSSGELVPDASPATFKTLGQGYAEDATHIFYDKDMLKMADVETFTLVYDSTGDYNYDAADKNHHYLSGAMIGK